jgi:hypothetical protein
LSEPDPRAGGSPAAALLLVGGFGWIVLLALRLGDVLVDGGGILVILPRPLVGIGGGEVRVGGVLLRAFQRIDRPKCPSPRVMPASYCR